MEDLLTTRQVLEYLKVDRITVYRMLNDGRLKGVKIGQHWRFSLREVERLLNGDAAVSEPEDKGEYKSGFPTHCVQTIQNLYSEVGQMHGLVVDPQGQPVTEPTHACDFCLLIQSCPDGLNACQAAWKTIAQNSAIDDQTHTCHAGLQYVSAPIFDNDLFAGRFLSGQFYWQPAQAEEEANRLRELARRYNLSLEDLQKAAAQIPVISPDQHPRIGGWPLIAAKAVQSILHERTGFIARLQKISDLSQIP